MTFLELCAKRDAEGRAKFRPNGGPFVGDPLKEAIEELADAHNYITYYKQRTLGVCDRARTCQVLHGVYELAAAAEMLRTDVCEDAWKSIPDDCGGMRGRACADEGRRSMTIDTTTLATTADQLGYPKTVHIPRDYEFDAFEVRISGVHPFINQDGKLRFGNCHLPRIYLREPPLPLPRTRTKESIPPLDRDAVIEEVASRAALKRPLDGQWLTAEEIRAMKGKP